jgi:hypothetical protein
MIVTTTAAKNSPMKEIAKGIGVMVGVIAVRMTAAAGLICKKEHYR